MDEDDLADLQRRHSCFDLERDVGGVAFRPRNDESSEAFDSFVRELMQRYGDRVKVHETREDRYDYDFAVVGPPLEA